MAEPMAEHVKAQLREINAKKRAQKTLLKDLTPDDLLVLCDYAEDRLGLTAELPPPNVTWGRYGRSLLYIKWATPAQVAALASRIPSVTHEVTTPGARPRRIQRTFFSPDFVEAVLRAGVNTDHSKYIGRALVNDAGVVLWM